MRPSDVNLPHEMSILKSQLISKKRMCDSPMKPLILTFSGKHVNPLNLRPEDIDIVDIAHALACCNRFAGHCRRPINVAQHSVYVSRLCDDTGFERQALLHDASEAYLGDITKWLKH